MMKFIQPFHSQDLINLVILLTVSHTILMMLLEAQRIILVLDQLIIAKLIFFFILITCLLDVVFNAIRKNSVKGSDTLALFQLGSDLFHTFYV